MLVFSEDRGLGSAPRKLGERRHFDRLKSWLDDIFVKSFIGLSLLKLLSLLECIIEIMRNFTNAISISG